MIKLELVVTVVAAVMLTVAVVWLADSGSLELDTARSARRATPGPSTTTSGLLKSPTRQRS